MQTDGNASNDIRTLSRSIAHCVLCYARVKWTLNIHRINNKHRISLLSKLYQRHKLFPFKFAKEHFHFIVMVKTC